MKRYGPLSNASGFVNLVERGVAQGKDELDGKVLTRPALLVTDGNGATYAVDVDLGNDVVLRNVPLSRANADLFYAEVGNPCRCRRTRNGQWEVVGFSKEMPGTYKRFEVSLVTKVWGPLEDLTVAVRPLTYEELSVYGVYGSTPYGALGEFRGGIFQGIR